MAKSAAFNLIFGAKTGKLQKDLKGVQRSMAILQRNLQNTGRKLTIGLTAPLAAIGTSAFRVAADFEASMSKVKAVSGATGDEFKQLEQLAKDLGKSTVFTASDVAGLEESFARLGFTTGEIINATEATLQLAQASGTDLANAADVAGSTLRAFGLDAAETGRVADVMASSFSQTALDVDGFQEAMKSVAPVAASAGLSVEQTTALLGSLANSGIRGSKAGTALRRIISELGTTSGDVAGEIESLAAEGLNLADAKDEVGRNAQSALLILANSIKTTDELTTSLENAEGASAAMAATMDDNAKGGIKRMQSAVEGAQIALGDALAPVVTEVAAKIGQLANSFSNLSEGTQKSIAGVGVFAASLGPISSGLGGMVGGVKNATKAVKFLSKAVKANPVGLLATALLVFGSAAIAFISNTDNMTEAQRENLRATREQNIELAKQAGLLKTALNLETGTASIKDLQGALSEVNKELGKFSTQKLAQDIEIDLNAKPGQQIKLGEAFSAINPQSKKTLQEDLQSQLSILTGQAVTKGLFGEDAIAFIRQGLSGNLDAVVAEYRAGLLARRDEINAALQDLIAADADTGEDPVEDVTPAEVKAPAIFDATSTATEELLKDLAAAELAIQSTFSVDGDAQSQVEDLASAYRSAAIEAAKVGDIDLSTALNAQAAAYQNTADAATNAAEAQLQASEAQQLAIQTLAGNVQSLITDIAAGYREANASYREGVRAVQEAFDDQQLTAEEFAQKQQQLEEQRKNDRQQNTLDLIQTYVAEAVAAMIANAIKTAAATGPGAFFLAPALAAGASSLVKGLFTTGVPALAEGGMTTGKTLALIGDNPSGKEMVVPFEKIPQFLNMFNPGQNISVHVSGKLRGQDILLSANKSTRSAQRSIASMAF